MNSSDPVLMQRAVDDVCRREESRTLSDADVARAAEKLLTLQITRSPHHLDRFFRAAHFQGKLADAQWQQYWRQMFPCSLAVTLTTQPNLDIGLSLSSNMPTWRCDDPFDYTVGFSAGSLHIGRFQCDGSFLGFGNLPDGRCANPHGQYKPATLGHFDLECDRPIPISLELNIIVSDSLPFNSWIATIPINVTTSALIPSHNSAAKGAVPAKPSPHL